MRSAGTSTLRSASSRSPGRSTTPCLCWIDPLMSQGPNPAEAVVDAVPAHLEMRHVYKNFGGARALEDVSFTARRGEVHALCGENGAGKSTLMKILAGAITEYEGEIRLSGRPARFAG